MPLLLVPGLLWSAQTPSPAGFEALLGPCYRADAPGAAVLVVKGDQVLFRKGYGLANVELGVAMGPERVFRIGSLTKQFTAAAVLLLVEDGKVELEAPLRQYLPELPEAWAKATVGQVLNHTAGIPDWVDTEAFQKQMGEERSPWQIVLHEKDKPLDFQPGSRWAYSNTGYLALGVLIEKVSGQSYFDFLGSRLLRPLGLNHTGFGDEKALIPGLVSGYTEDSRPAPYINMGQPGAAGALVSSVDDLARWTLALHGGKVLKPESYARMVKDYPLGPGSSTQYGFGLGLRGGPGRQLVWHNGEINGFHAYLEADPQLGTVVVILTNSDASKVDDRYLSRRLLGLAAGRPVPEPTPVALSAEQLQSLVGKYQGSTGGPRSITLAAGQLTYRNGSGSKWVLTPLSATEFFRPGFPAWDPSP